YIGRSVFSFHGSAVHYCIGISWLAILKDKPGAVYSMPFTHKGNDGGDPVPASLLLNLGLISCSDQNHFTIRIGFHEHRQGGKPGLIIRLDAGRTGIKNEDTASNAGARSGEASPHTIVRAWAFSDSVFIYRLTLCWGN